MRAITAVFGACVLLIPILPAAAAAQSSPSGLWLNAHLNGSTFSSDGLPEPETGGGGGVGLGWAITRGVMVFMHMDGATMPGATSDANYQLGHADLGLRLSLGLGSWSPYVLVAGTTRVAKWEDLQTQGPFGPIYYDMTLRGGGGTVGLGLQKMVTRRLAVDGAVMATRGKFSDGEVDQRPVVFDTYQADTGRLVLGLSWYSRGR
jgi:hypothetical protein